MSAFDEILGQLPLDQIADRLGVDRTTAQAAVSSALPALVAGLRANAQDPDGAASLASALGQHDNGLFDAGSGLEEVDEADGEKIVSHVFGENTDAVASHLGGIEGLGGQGGLGGSIIAKVLPLIAPYVMSYLAKQVFGRGASQEDASAAENPGGLDLGSILGSILGGGTGTQPSSGDQAGGIDLGAILGGLGGLLGGGRR